MKAIIFAGQGSQVEAMGQDFYETYPVAQAYYDDLGQDLRDMILQGDLETLSQTPNTQPALIGYQTMIIELFKEAGIDFDYTAGLSIGEYSALVQARVLKSQDAIEIAKVRGKLMDEAARDLDSKMLAIMGMGEEDLRVSTKEASRPGSLVEISNLNCPGQIVVSGEAEAVDRLEDLIKGQARRTVSLNTSGPFHTSYMEPVEKDLAKIFDSYDFKEEKIPLAYNYTGDFRKEEKIQDLMAKQVSSTVRFEDILKRLVDSGVKTFVEVGFGGVIKGFVRRVDKTLQVVQIDSVENFKTYISEVKND